MDPLPSTMVPLLLVAVIFASWAMFALLVDRWTHHRGEMELAEWADANGFRISQSMHPLDESLAFLSVHDPRPLQQLQSAREQIVQLQSAAPRQPGQDFRWNLLIRQLPMRWALTLFRPIGRAATLADYLPLESMYSTAPGPRFVLYGDDPPTARLLAHSRARGLLPPDVGMFLSGRKLILDFSSRVFDPLELQRMESLADQLVAHLPQRA